MNKSEFIASVAEKAEMSKAAAARAVDAIFDTASGAIAEAVNTVGQVSIPGFGKFSSKKRAARTGRNPRTGQEIKIPERTRVAFSAGKGLKESVSGTAKPKASRSKSTAAGGTRSGGSTAAKGTTSAKKPAGSGTAARSASSGSKGGGGKR